MLFPKIHKCCPSQIFEQGTEYDFEIYLTTGMSFSGNIEGIITDSYSNPIEGVQIESEGYYACNPAECTSDSEGHYSIMQESSNKSIIVRANADGYEVAEAGVSLREGGNVTRNFTLVREDECPDDLEKTEPGVCGCDVPDTDIDNDEKLDCEDNCPGTYNPDQADTDGDKIGDVCDNCISIANPDQADTDSDNAGNACDGCPDDPEKNEPGICGCGVPDTDIDNDEKLDCEDNCPGTYNPDQADTDGDKIGDVCDNCISIANPDQADTDSDRLGNACDNCPNIGNADQADADGDKAGNACDSCPDDPAKTDPGQFGCGNSETDTDGDGVPDNLDNCPDIPNPEQKDADGDRIGDMCDNCISIANPEQADTDSDRLGNACDNCPDIGNADQADADGDNVGNACDGCPDDPDKTGPGQFGCGNSEADTDGDGVPYNLDNCPDIPNPDPCFFCFTGSRRRR